MSESVYRVFDNGAGTMLAVGGLGLILRSTNGGADWVAQESGVENHLYGVSWGYVIDTPGWVVVGEFGIVLISEDDGVTWENRSSGVQTDLYAVAYGQHLCPSFVPPLDCGLIMRPQEEEEKVNSFIFTAQKASKYRCVPRPSTPLSIPH